jgi:Cys-tRNA(Pro) deacylase
VTQPLPFPDGERRALAAADALGLTYRVARHGPVRSLAEAADARGVRPSQVLKTIVVRRGEGDFLFVLVPGDREISWARLRTLLGVNRISMPDAATALAATGYARGTITPLGALHAWPVVADERVADGEVSLGAGASGVALTLDGATLAAALGATLGDVTDPSP